MPEIYNESHPYYNPDDGRYQSASFMHRLIFGDGIEKSFPEQLHILTRHESEWFHYCAEYSNTRSEDYFKDIPSLGDYLRTNMVDDVFITQNKVEYYFPEGDHRKSWDPKWEDFFKKDEDGKLIRLPVKCVINFISIRFRNEVDKTQLQLVNDGQYRFMDELEVDRIMKLGARHHDEPRKLLCPLCKVNYDETKNKKENGEEDI